ncbi:MAG: hypothetical protein ABI836_09275 [Gemmatimonadota bacterium]
MTENLTMDPGLRMLLLMFVVGSLILGEIVARLSPGWGYAGGKSVMRGLMLLMVGVYAGSLLAVSLTSREKVLPRGTDLRFCGFYFDCHMGVAVDSVVRTPTLGEARAQGEFVVVALRVSSNAIRATMRMANPRYEVLAAAGRRYERSAAGEAAFTGLTGAKPALVQPVAAGGAYNTVVVFDLPANIQLPRLLVRDVSGVDVVLEGLLIGDEDSFLHQPTTLALQ